jgi:hypothetical protein
VIEPPPAAPCCPASNGTERRAAEQGDELHLEPIQHGGRHDPSSMIALGEETIILPSSRKSLLENTGVKNDQVDRCCLRVDARHLRRLYRLRRFISRTA